MSTESAIPLHPRSTRRRELLAHEASRIAGGILLVAAVAAGGAIVVVLGLLLVVVAAPIGAALALWVAWRTQDLAAVHARRVRAHLRRRARALGLHVYAGAAEPVPLYRPARLPLPRR